MLKAAPGETLDFQYAIAVEPVIKEESKPELTIRQKKMRRRKLMAFQEKLNRKLEEKVKARRSATCPIPPRYDDVFFEGLEKLNESAGTPPDEGEYLAFFSEDVWKSKARHDPELS